MNWKNVYRENIIIVMIRFFWTLKPVRENCCKFTMDWHMDKKMKKEIF